MAERQEPPSAIADVDFFFADPVVEPHDHRRPDGGQSVLYLLRREAMDCLIGKVVPEDAVAQHQERHRLFAASMVSLAGVDLLAKFAAGNDDQGQVGQRFEDFARRYLQIAGDAASALYTARNALLHSFGLYDQKGNMRLVLQESCGVSDDLAPAVRNESGLWVICVAHLHRTFVQGVRRYEDAVRKQKALQDNFAAMFPRYSSVRVF